MTNEEAKEKLYLEWQKFLEDNIDYAGISEAYKTAFKALEQEPCENMERKIEKEYLFESLCEDLKKLQVENENLRNALEQKQKTGHWIADVDKQEHHVQFVSYDGKYPNLCSGKLTLNIDGEVVDFHYDHTKADYTSFWSSGGSCGFAGPNYSGDYVNKGEWNIYEDSLPDKYKKYVNEIREVFNENVPYGCCGGCL